MLPAPVLDATELERIIEESFGSTGAMSVVAVTSDGVIMSLDATDRHGRPGGTVSGPALMTLADTAAWMAILSRIGAVVLAVTTSLHIDFLRKPSVGTIEADARLLKLGQRLAVVDVTMRSSGNDAVVAKAQVTYSIPPR